MQSSKQDRYMDLIQRVRESYRYAPAGLSWCDDCQEINLWTYWQGKNCEDVRILLVGQDWGCPFDSSSETVMSTIRNINQGKGIPYMDHNDSATDQNLIELFQSIGYDISWSGQQYKDLFFTNFVMGYRKSGTSGGFQSEWTKHDAAQFKELVELLEPEYIFCLGKDTFLGVLDSVEIKHPSINSFNQFIVSEDNPIKLQLPTGVYTNVCALAHCGKLGTLNRNRRWNPVTQSNQTDDSLDIQKEDWQWVLRTRQDGKRYHKLVRDRIPEIIQASGKDCEYEILSEPDYIRMLDEKLNEELAEYQESKSLEELADLTEVMHAVVKARGWTIEQLEQARLKKADERGGFEKRILLKGVSEKETDNEKVV